MKWERHSYSIAHNVIIMEIVMSTNLHDLARKYISKIKELVFSTTQKIFLKKVV